MAEVIREGVIKIRLEQGEVTLKAPDVKPVEQAYETHRKATAAATKETQKLDASMKELDEAYKAQAKAAQDVADAIEKQIREIERAEEAAVRYARRALEGVTQVAEGFFRLARAAVLLGIDSEDGLGKVIQELARVQAAFDIFRGLSQIINGVGIALQSLAAAYAQMAAAAGSATAAQTAFAASATRAATAIAGVAAVLSTVVLVVGIVVAAIYGLWKLIDYFWESEAEAAEKARQELEALDKRLAAQLELQAEAERRERERNAILFERLSLEEKLANIRERVDRAGQSSRVSVQADTPNAARADLELNRNRVLDGIAALEQEAQLEQERLRAALKVRDAKIDEIEKAERLVSLAQRAYDLEEKKLRSFQAQVGAASKLEQQQLIAIRDKLRAGQELTAFEENQLARLGGEQGRSIVENRRAQRGAAAGFGEDFFDGIEGASDGMKDAAEELARAAEKLNELTSGATAAEAIARLEKEKEELEKQYQEFYRKNSEQLAALVKILEMLDKKIRVIERVLQTEGR